LGFVFIAVLLALWSLDARVSPDAAGRYVTPLVTLSATMFWVLFAKSAHVASWVPNRTWLFALHMAVVGFCVMTAVEFSIWFWESPRTRVGRWASRVMRFISVAHAALLMYFAVRDQPENINSTYVAFGALFVPALLYASSLGIVRLFRGDRRPFGVVMASTLCAILFAGIHDIVRERMELGPPIFPAGVIIFGVFEALVVLGGFLQVAVRNIELSTSLSAANVELERALVMADEANRSKAEFLANISHEMRTPLNAIVHLPVALARNFEVGTDGSGRFVGDAEAVRADLVHIAKSSRGLYRVINDILDISRLEAGAEKLHVEQVDPVVLARRALGATRAFAATRDIDIRVTMPEPGAITMEGDPARIVQVLENLLSNAIQFSHQGGVVELSLRSDERAVHFSVRDEGVGIDAAHHALIFESFRQVESGNKRGTTGSGLGLAITKCVVDLHGGEIRLKSARGEGATFDVTFPRGVPISMAS
ncbi:MAG: hypothetical protein KC417_15210, partial [Myxococcales bacterium]|nr:hypothetical protein [Myxococcales bacterium]